MNQQIASTTAGNGESTPHDLFALTDEQILEIEPEAEPDRLAPAVISSEARNLSSSSATDQASQSKRDSSSPSAARNDRMAQIAPDAADSSHESPVTSHVAAEQPPTWLAAQMKDPWTGEEARELWNGVQQAKSETAAYRAAFATPEDARALKELYPGGVSEARAAAERASLLDDIDQSYFGGAGKSAQEMSASRAQLAQRMLQEDPAAFREMVFAGLRALEASGPQANSVTSVGAHFSATSPTAESPAAQTASNATQTQGGLKSASANSSTERPSETQATEHGARLAAYASFERAANDELERSVGGTIERTLGQALPNASRVSNASGVEAQHAAPLQARLSAAIRQDVEAALKSDRQLSEQVAQVLSSKRLDNETRAQVVRLIGERAQQLVPVAAKRVLSDWTQTTLAAHRTRGDRSDAASARRDVSPAGPEPRRSSSSEDSFAISRREHTQDANRAAARPDSRRVDYRKLSDEQILDL